MWFDSFNIFLLYKVCIAQVSIAISNWHVTSTKSLDIQITCLLNPNIEKKKNLYPRFREKFIKYFLICELKNNVGI